MSYEQRSLFESLLLLHGVPFRNYTGTLLVLDCRGFRLCPVGAVSEDGAWFVQMVGY